LSNDRQRIREKISQLFARSDKKQDISNPYFHTAEPSVFQISPVSEFVKAAQLVPNLKLSF